jgi:hypothetical protein
MFILHALNVITINWNQRHAHLQILWHRYFHIFKNNRTFIKQNRINNTPCPSTVAPIHISGKFTENVEISAGKGLITVNILTHSPELNLTEILWHKIKAELFLCINLFRIYKNRSMKYLAVLAAHYHIR